MNRLSREYPAALDRHPGGEGGVALAMVVWFLAAMSLLVMGIVDHARVDVRMAQAHAARAKAVAAGDGAIQLMMLRLQGAGEAGERSLSHTFRLGGDEVRVQVTPAVGLPDLFTAPEPVLLALLTSVGGLEAAEAQQLASNVVQLRGGSGRSGRLGSLEDVLRIPGFNRALLDSLRDSVRAVPGSSGRIDWAQAPPVLLSTLRGVIPERYASASQRGGRTAGDNNKAGVVTSGTFRVDAMVDYGGRTWLRRRWIQSGRSSDESNLPWRIIRSEAPRVVRARAAKGVK